MLWTLVRYDMRRSRSMYPMAAGLAAFWLTAGGESGAAASSAIAASMACAFFAGPVMGLAVPQFSPLIYLPLSRRDLWHSRLVVGLAVPVAVILAAKLLPLAMRAPLQMGGTVTLRTVLISSLFDLAYAGAGVAVFTWADPGLRAQRGVATLGAAAGAASLLVFGLGPVWPWIFRRWLPTDWGQMGWGSYLLVAAALLSASATLLHEPTHAHPGRTQRNAPGARTACASWARSTPVVGLLRLVWPEVALRTGLIVVTGGAFWLVDLLFIEHLGAGMLSDNLLVGGVALVYLALPTPMGVAAAIRPLRALPISSRALGALLAALPLTTLLAASSVFAAASWLSGVRPAAPAALVVCLVGVVPLVNAVGLAVSGVFGGGLFLGPVLGVVGFFAYFATRLPVSPPGLVTAALIATASVIAAVCLNVRTLRRSRSVYLAAVSPLSET